LAGAKTATKISNIFSRDCSNGGEEALLRTLAKVGGFSKIQVALPATDTQRRQHKSSKSENARK
jgi:hypothetical protein